MSSKLEVIFDDKSSVDVPVLPVPVSVDATVVEGTEESVSAENLLGEHAVLPFRASADATALDDADEFVSLEDPVGKLASDAAKSALHKVSAVDWYRARSIAYGVTNFTIIENLLETAEKNPSENIDLNFNRCGYTNVHVQIALDALLNSIRPQCLTALRLCRNRLFDSSLTRYLGNVLQELQTITNLSVSFNTLDDECIAVLGDAMSNSGVRWFEADHCQITDAGGSRFFTAMAYSDCIERVQLNWNHLGMVSGVAIGKFLATQRSLVQLHLSGNHLYPEVQSIVPLLQGLIGNEVLEDLDLSWNGLRGETFAKALLKGIPQSKLKRLNLEHNLLATEEMAFVIRMLKKSETLLELCLGGNAFEEESSVELARVAGRHVSLVLLSYGCFHFVSARTAKLCKFFSRKMPAKRFVYQGILLANPPRPVDAQGALLERCRFLAMKPKQAKQKRDIGHLMLQFRALENAVLTRDEFTLAVKQFRAKLDRPLVDALMDAFGVSKGYVDAGAMANKYLTLHPTDPPAKVAKGAKGKSNRKK